MSLVILILFTFGLLAISVFKKHMLINFAIELACLGILYVSEISTLEGMIFLQMAVVLLIIYEINEMSKMRVR